MRRTKSLHIIIPCICTC